MANKKKKVLKKSSNLKKQSKKPAKALVKKAVKKAIKKTAKKAVKKAAKSVKVKPVKQAQKANAVKSVVVSLPKKNIDYAKAVTPLLDRLVVRVVQSERVTAGGLIIPDSASMATGYLKAEVLAVGTGIKTKKGYLKPLDVKIGDKVLFAEYSGTKVEFNSEELQIIHESDVMGIMQD